MNAFSHWLHSLWQRITARRWPQLASLSTPHAVASAQPENLEQPPDLFILGSESEAMLAHIHDRPDRPSAALGSHTTLPVSMAIQLAGAAPAIQMALKAGRLVELVGPPDALRNLASGAWRFLESGGKLGTVVDGSGKIVRQVRFGELAKLAAVGPAVFQVATVVTGQIHLAEITQKLGALQRSVDDVLSRQVSEVYGRIQGARSRVEEVERLTMAGVLPKESTLSYLASIDQDLMNSFHECKRNLLVFQDRYPSNEVESMKARALKELLQSLQGRAHEDLVMIAGIIQARSRYYRALMGAVALHSPEKLAAIQEATNNNLTVMLQTGRDTGEYIGRLQNACVKRLKTREDSLVAFMRRDELITLEDLSQKRFPVLTVLQALPAVPATGPTRIHLWQGDDGQTQAVALRDVA